MENHNISGKLTEAEIRANVKPLFATRIRLGEFDPENMNPYNRIDMDVVQVTIKPENTKKILLHQR